MSEFVELVVLVANKFRTIGANAKFIKNSEPRQWTNRAD
jgi:hypothetical protein